MSESYPSKKAVITDVPEVTNFKTSFVYNFFSNDEQLNGSLTTIRGSVSGSLKRFDATTIATNFSAYKRFVPRYVEFKWNPVITTTNDIRTEADVANDISIAANRRKIYDEETFAIEDFKNVSFQDNQIDGKMGFFVKRLTDDLKNASKPSNSNTETTMDLTSYANRNTSNNVTPDFLADALHDLTKSEMQYSDENGNDIIAESILSELKTVRTDVQINKKFLNTVLQTSRENPINIYYDEISNETLNQARIEQESAISNNPSSMVRGADYDIEIAKYVKLKLVKSNFFESQSHVIGYIIEKIEYPKTSATTIVHPEIIVESPFVGSTIDLNVKYGSTYEYKIYTVVSFTVRSVNVDTSQVVAITFLMRSKPSINIVICDEKVSPPPPADFNVIWDYNKRKPLVNWSFPINPQRDIKYFQVFRRKTINEPFELIAMYDFDDSLVKTRLQESNIRGYLADDNSSLVIKNLQTQFLDEDFKQYEDTYIYSVCCVDAHGYSSNYGPQVQISFNKSTNSINKKMISRTNAAKSYPNMNILQDLFVDTIKSSGAKRMHIYFTPEYLDVYKVKNKTKYSLNLLNTNRKNSHKNVYKIQMINVDLQKQQILTCRLNDKR